MGFLGFFNFALTCFDHLAWPLFSLGYPLYASIHAIETNSNYHMRKLVTYWILFSLICLLELAFVKLIEWIPVWPYIKVGTICWLVLPRFNGAHYCYKILIQPCLSMNLEQVMKRLYKRQKTSVEKDNFLSVVERYVTENGTEALEKLIASKGRRTGFGVEDIEPVAEAGKLEIPSLVKGSETGLSVDEINAEAEKKEMHKMVKGSRADLGVEKVKAVTEIEKREMPQMVKSKGNEFKVDHKDISRMEQPGKHAPVPENSPKGNEFNIVHEDINKMEEPGKHAPVPENSPKGNEFNIVHEDINKMEQPGKHAPVPENSPKGNEFNIVHEDINKMEQPGKHAPVPENSPKGNEFNIVHEDINKMEQPGKHAPVPENSPKGNEFNIVHEDINKMEEPGRHAPVPENSVKLTDTVLLQANKKKTVETVEVKEMTKPPVPPTATEEALPTKTPLEKVQKEWTCAVCQVTTTCEANLNSHLTGMKHRTKCEELNSKSTKSPTQSKAGPSSPASKGAHDDQGSTKPDKVKKQNEKVQVKIKSEGDKQNADNNSSTGSTHLKYWCPYCAVTCMSETYYLSHLNGMKHWARVQEMTKPPVPPTATEEALPAKTPLEKVQKEWTCAVCQVTTSCEASLNSHLTGKKHRTKCEELNSKSTKSPTQSKAGPSSPARKGAHDDQGSTKPDKVNKQNEKVQGKVESKGGKQKADNNNSSTESTHIKRWCPYCAVTCQSETTYLSHLNGKKHLARVQAMAVYPAAVQQGWDYSAFPYNCNF